MSATAFRLKLIEEVKKFPVLYDTGHQNHRDIDVRDRAWMDISQRLGENSESLKREWKSLRDSLRQALKKTKSDCTTKAGAPRKKWRFMGHMAFVLPYMTKRKLLRNTYNVKEDLDKTDTMDMPSDQEDAQGPWDPGNEDHGSLELFFASVCQSTKRLPKKLQNEVKRQVLDILLKAEEDYEAEQNLSKVDTKNFELLT